jgi:site-specific recombinase XerD
MSKTHRTARAKPNKPYPDFPLTAHPAGYWCKKIRGKIYYFGPWEDPQGALAKYLEQRDALHAGRTPRPDPGEVTVKDAANAFLNVKQVRRDAGELSPHTFRNYKAAADEAVAALGKHRLVIDLLPADFAALRDRLASRWGLHRLGVTIQYVRSLFKHAFEAGLIDRPVRFGPGFDKPSRKALRLHRAAQGPKMFTADEVRRLLAAAGVPLKAMLLLAVNCGLGNSDCGNLPLSALDLDAAMIDFPRPKTGLPRRCPLWPETVVALREALAERPAPKDEADAGLAFVTRKRGSYHKETTEGSPISKEVRKLLDKLGIDGRRNFYTLRHTFRTVADAAKDQPAADFIMGHEVPHMSSLYREGVDDDRLRAVAEHVRRWLFPPATPPATQTPPA